MPTAGPNPPGTAADDNSTGTVAWSNPGNVTASDDTRATAALGASAKSHYLIASNFGFAIPGGSTVDGIEVEIERSADAVGRAKDAELYLYHPTLGTSADKADTFTTWGTTDAAIVYGNSADVWGFFALGTEVNDSTFAVYLAAQNGSLSAVSARVDRITVTVYYTAGGGGGGSQRRTLLLMGVG